VSYGVAKWYENSGSMRDFNIRISCRPTVNVLVSSTT